MTKWELFTDWALSKDGLGIGVIFINLQGDKSTYALRFKFNCLNNEAEYEALLAGLRLAKSMKISSMKVSSDLMLVVNQIKVDYEAKETHIQKYLA